MHEVALAEEILQIISGIATENQVKEVLSADVTVGKLMAVEIDNLAFALDTLKAQFAGTESTEFCIVEQPVTVLCDECGCTTEVSDWLFICGSCKSRNVSVVTGDTMEVTAVEIPD